MVTHIALDGLSAVFIGHGEGRELGVAGGGLWWRRRGEGEEKEKGGGKLKSKNEGKIKRRSSRSSSSRNGS
jgi:hypothetical protein